MKQIELKGYWNTLLLLFIQFLILIILYAGQRGGFYFYNQALFPGVTADEFMVMLWGGVKFDTVAILYVNILYILLQTVPFPFKYREAYQIVGRWFFKIASASCRERVSCHAAAGE